MQNDALRLEVTANYSNIKNNYVANSNNAGFQGSLIGATISFNPTIAPINNLTGLYSEDGNNRNPAAFLNYFEDKDNINMALKLLEEIKDWIMNKKMLSLGFISLFTIISCKSVDTVASNQDPDLVSAQSKVNVQDKSARW